MSGTDTFNLIAVNVNAAVTIINTTVLLQVGTVQTLLAVLTIFNVAAGIDFLCVRP